MGRSHGCRSQHNCGRFCGFQGRDRKECGSISGKVAKAGVEDEVFNCFRGEVKEGFLTWIVKKNGGFDVILAADAGMEALYRDHILPDIIVGDFDSVNPDTLEYFS